MGKTVTSLCLLVALGIALAACSMGFDGKEPEVNPNIVPANYKKEITDTLTQTLSDPTNVRDAYISDPVLRSAAKEERYTVCVRFNARDANQKYMGITDHIAYFYGGHLNQLIEATKEQCGNAPYKPFPELEKLCLGVKCN